ncbi:carotenoid oxygenase family protein [Streptomyces sp. NPDC002088]|uniref:carotenoid oxygenase family protein n=1 Tax=Streptomyces sp. NPDC002088 TaxID=3154665 RepID=UPI00331959FF
MVSAVPLAPQAPLRCRARLEEAEISALPVKGELPQQLDGTLVRIGPDCADGQPLVAALRMRQGHAEWFRTRRIRTDLVCKITGELPTPGPRLCPSDNANSAVVQHAGRILALGDGVLPYELTSAFVTKARHDFDGTLPFGFAASPVQDPLTGELFAAVATPEAPHLWYVVVDASGRVRSREPIPTSSCREAPAFAVTHRHVVFSESARIGIMPRAGTVHQLTWIDIEPGCVGPMLNAFDLTDDRLVLDMLRPGTAGSTLWRWTLDPVRKTAVGVALDHHAQESPTLDPRHRGSEYRYGFATQLADTACHGSALIRHDMVTGTRQIHGSGSGRIFGAPVFVPRSPIAPEGDGWLLAFTNHTISGSHEVVVVDTNDFEAEPTAVVGVAAVEHRGAQATWLMAAPW